MRRSCARQRVLWAGTEQVRIAQGTSLSSGNSSVRGSVSELGPFDEIFGISEVRRVFRDFDELKSGNFPEKWIAKTTVHYEIEQQSQSGCRSRRLSAG